MDDLFESLVDLFGEVGIYFVSSGVLVTAIVVELAYHFIHGGWLT